MIYFIFVTTILDALVYFQMSLIYFHTFHLVFSAETP